MNHDSIVERIRSLANLQGLSLTTLEVKLNLGNGTISRWNKSSPNSDKLMRVADYFYVSIDYLLGRSPNLQLESISSTRTGPWTRPVSSAPTLEDKLRLAEACGIPVGPNLTDVEIDLLEKFRQLDNRGKSAVLNALNHEYALLPGEKSQTSKQA